MGHNYYELEELPLHQLPDLAEFVVKQNYEHHTDESYPSGYRRKINVIYQEELNYFENSKIYLAKDPTGLSVGSIRVLKWNGFNLLPLQKLFDVSIEYPGDYSVWHIGRFAIHRGVRNLDLLKKLMICSIHPVCQNCNSIVYAECDKKLLRTLSTLGIEAIPIGKPINYLGSDTIPIKISYSGLIDFYTKYKHLRPKSLLLSLKKINNNYTFD